MRFHLAITAGADYYRSVWQDAKQPRVPKVATMNEQQALAKMIPPGTKRPNIWSNGVLQIWITRSCDLSCSGCTQGSNLAGNSGRISLQHFETAVQSLKGYFGVVGIFGGNPALHPQFNEICDILAANVPWAQRGLWCNHPRGKMAAIRKTFNPRFSNLNVHLVRAAYDEFVSGWPELVPYIKGLDPAWPEAEEIKRTKSAKEYAHRVGDARHSPPYLAMQDLDRLPLPNGDTIENTIENRWDLISDCDINRNWSAMIAVFRDQLRGFFCEIAGAQAILHQNEPDYPDTGVSIVPGWWQEPMTAFAAQARHHCHACGIPLRLRGELAVGGTVERVTQTHAGVVRPKSPGRTVQLVQLSTDVNGTGTVQRVTDYIENGDRQSATP